MQRALSNKEIALLLAVVVLALVAVLAPALAQPPNHHNFADQRTWWGVPHAMDVLSNLPFALAGAAGGWLLLSVPVGGVSNVQRAMAALFFGGLLMCATGSSWYHLHPDDAGLAVDRYAMGFAFAGLLGLAAAGRVSERAGAALGLAGLVLAPAAVHAWAATGNVLPWAVVQFGGVLVLVGMALGKPVAGALNVRWSPVLFAYGVAKAFEMQDHTVYELTGGWLAGHTVKHVVAALAALPVIAAIRAVAMSMQNPAGITLARDLAARAE